MSRIQNSGQAHRYITYHHDNYKDIDSRLTSQRAGYTHPYNNLYEVVYTLRINVRMVGFSLIEGNWFENVKNPVTVRDNSSIGY